MFDRLGAFVARHWLLVLLIWAVLVGGIHLIAPHWDEVTRDGDFAYLPKEMTSVVGQNLLNEAFPEILSKSQVVLVVSRADGELQGADFAMAQRLVDQFTAMQGDNSPIVDVKSYETPVIGKKLISRPSSNGQAVLIALMLRNEFMAIDNWGLMTELYEQLDTIRAEDDFPEGLRLDVTGSAVVGYDMLHSAGESIRNTELTTIVLVVLILLLVYRAPGLVIVPLTTIVVSVVVAMDLVAIVTDISTQTQWYDFKVFKTSKIFIVVILFGAGTDYCLFLISRYREELRHGLETPRALAVSLGQVGNALAASALTTIFGLGMMAFADFGKFSYSGPAIALCLVVALAACMTLAPALLRAGGRVVFWPFGVGTPLGPNEPAGSGVFTGFWHRLSRVVIARPGLILVGSLLLLAPLVCVGWSVPITYDLLSEMQEDRPSVQGVRQLGRHFVTSEIDPITLLVHDPDGQILAMEDGALEDSALEDSALEDSALEDSALEDDGRLTKESRRHIALLTKSLYELEYLDSDGQQVKPITSVRSLTEPLGNPPGSFNPFSAAGRDKLMVLQHHKTRAIYVSHAPGYVGKVTRFDLVCRYKPFSEESVRLLDDIERQLKAMADKPDSKWHRVRFTFVGTTAGIRDLELVTKSDQIRIQQLVVLSVLFVMVLILRRPIICLYLILSVLLGYFVTIGITELVFASLYGDAFHGLDWKVPIFLFVILVAIGEDYNIYLVTRVFEEQKRLGPMEGLRMAVVRTGGIITSCGVIMAGTFASMITGTLGAMHQLGFALALGVLLDAFIIRTILVPAFLAILARREIGNGSEKPSDVKTVCPKPTDTSHDSRCSLRELTS